MSDTHVGLIILSLFCGGGLFAYGREVVRLRRLMSVGTVMQATVVKKEKIDTGSESVIHFLVTYEFVDEEGQTRVHEVDLNSGDFFESLSVGGRLEILHESGRGGSSHPLGHLRRDLGIAQWICVGLLLVWGFLGAFFVLT